MSNSLNNPAELVYTNGDLQKEVGRREEAEERLRLFIEYAPAAIAMFDRDMRYLVVSRRWLADYHLQEDVIGKSHYEVFPEVSERWKEAHRRGLAGEVLRADEDAFERADGSVQWLRWEIRPWRTGGGEVGGIIIFAEEVSEEKRAAEAVRESERRYRSLAEALPQLVWTDLPDGTCDYLSSQWETYTGIAVEELLGFNWLDRVLHPDDRERTLQCWMTAVADKGVYDLEYRIRRHDGHYRWFKTRGVPIRDEQGRIVQWFGTCTDVEDFKQVEEALRQSEARFRQLADMMSQLAWMARPDGHLYWYNQRWYEYTGTTFEQMEGWGWQSVHDPEELPKVLKEWKGAIATGQPFDMVFPLKGKDGAYRQFLTRSMPLKDQVGRILHWFGTNTDVSEIKEKEEALKEADRRKDEFLAMLGHELRNPLAAIRNGLHVLLLSKGNGEILGQIKEMMEKQTNNLTRMVDDLLDVSRITRGKIQLRKEKVVLATVLNHAVESARPLIEAQRHTLTVLPASPPIHLEADPTRLEQVFVNLLTNAAKYTKQGGYITVTEERSNGEAVIRVRDNGMGVRRELLPKMFDLFVQSERSLDRSQGGLGIGLTLVRKIVEMHGGTVEAQSEGVDKGSEFVVRLPALPKDGEDREAPSEVVSTEDGKLRVLVVEDTEDVARTLRMLLELWGYDVRVADDGPAALVAYRTYQPDVVLLDIGLPGMNGYDVARQLRRQQDGKRPFIMAVTGYGQEDDKRRSEEAGFDYHMTKPVEPAKLQTVLAGVGGAA